VTGETDFPNSALDEESSRLKDSLRSCHKLVANYRAMLAESSNDNAPEDSEGEIA